MNVLVKFPYKSVLMRDLNDLMKKAGLVNLEDMVSEALTYHDIMKEGEEMGMYMISSPYDNTDELKVIDDIITAEHMEVGSIDLTLEAKGAENLKATAGTDDLSDFFTRLLVMYEQVAQAKFEKKGIALFDPKPENPRLSWTRVTREDDAMPANAQYPTGPLLN